MSKILAINIFLSFSLIAQNSTILIQHKEERELYNTYFAQAAVEFDVPADILRGISFAETRWTHMKWSDDDAFSICTGMPRVYGVMGLWDNDYFGHSLTEAAQLINTTPQDLKDSPLQNIRGAAALIRKYYSELPKPSGVADGSLESWQNAISKFSGFPQEEIAQQRGAEIYSVLSTGYSRDRIHIAKRTVDLEKIQSILQNVELKRKKDIQREETERAANQPDYPLAKWNPAYSGNFGTSLIQQKFVVIHDVEGSYLGCISWFKNPSAVVSSQYVLNSHPNGVSGTSPSGTPDAPVGEVTQMVEEKYRAYHVGCWNSFMIGIEHEGYAGVSGWFTPECYASSSKLVSYLCDKYNIPKDRNHVIAHAEHLNSTWRNWVTSTGQGFDPTCNSHTDPGPYWDWTGFMALVTASDTVKPQVLSALPSASKLVPTYKEIVIAFNTAMDITTTNVAFSITPIVTGSKSWSDGNKVLTFKSSSNLAFNTAYTIKIDTTAKNISLKQKIGPFPFVSTFTTVPVDTIGPKIASSYPYANAVDVSVTPEIWIEMTDAVQTNTLSGTLKFVDENNASVSMPKAKNDIIDDRGVITFFPNLKPNQTYTLKVLPGIKDYYNNVSTDSVVISFTTGAGEKISQGIIIDQLETNGRDWQQPKQSLLSVGIDTAVTSFMFSSEKVVNGTFSGKLSYTFSGNTNGIVHLSVNSMPVIDSYSTLGMWVYGDMNFHRLKAMYSPNDQGIDLGKIHWRGWKFVSMQTGSLTGTSKKLISLEIQQDSSQSPSGILFFDDMQLDAVISGIRLTNNIHPQDFQLKQNYPNPFNPSTTISFSVPTSGFVSLNVYDLLGRKISTVVSEVKSSGEYSVTFDAENLPSGIYYYTMRSGGNTMTNKMILLR